MLRLPLQENVALRILLNVAKNLFCLRRVVHAGCNVSLDQHGIQHIEPVSVWWHEGNCLIGVIACLLQISRPLRNQRERHKSIEDVFSAVDLFC